MSDKKVQIIESATKMIRSGGYNAFSFREIADDVGVKSSSVHHYFRRKENLAVAVAVSYTERFFNSLGDPESSGKTRKDRLRHYGRVFRQAFKVSGRACLCGVLSHEAPALPEIVVNEVERFVDRNLDWLTKVYSTGSPAGQPTDPEAYAFMTYSALEGAMAVATLKKNVRWLDLVQKQIEDSL